MFCPNCGNKMSDEARFCSNCGWSENNYKENAGSNSFFSKVIGIVIIILLFILVRTIFFGNNVEKRSKTELYSKSESSKYTIETTESVELENNLQNDIIQNEQQQDTDVDEEISDSILSQQIKNVKVITDYYNSNTIHDFETVTFGSYPQSDETGVIKDPIEWIVLERDEENYKALLLSKYILDCKRYDMSSKTNYSWRDSELRAWLNDEFINSISFYDDGTADSEKNVILDTKVDYRWIKVDDTLGKITGRYSRTEYESFSTDRIFILSDSEYGKYFRPQLNEVNKCAATCGTNYAKNVYNHGRTLSVPNANDWRSGNSPWWLRSMDITSTLTERDLKSNYFDFVFIDGKVSASYDVDTRNVGVRPAMWVSY